MKATDDMILHMQKVILQTTETLTVMVEIISAQDNRIKKLEEKNK